MRVKVLQTFKDRHTKEIHKKGSELTISPKRFAEILEVGPLVEELIDGETEPVTEEVAKKPAEVKPKKAKKSNK